MLSAIKLISTSFIFRSSTDCFHSTCNFVKFFILKRCCSIKFHMPTVVDTQLCYLSQSLGQMLLESLLEIKYRDMSF